MCACVLVSTCSPSLQINLAQSLLNYLRDCSFLQINSVKKMRHRTFKSEQLAVRLSSLMREKMKFHFYAGGRKIVKIQAFLFAWKFFNESHTYTFS